MENGMKKLLGQTRKEIWNAKDPEKETSKNENNFNNEKELNCHMMRGMGLLRELRNGGKEK